MPFALFCVLHACGLPAAKVQLSSQKWPGCPDGHGHPLAPLGTATFAPSECPVNGACEWSGLFMRTAVFFIWVP